LCAGHGASKDAVIGALEVLRGLSEDHLQSVSADECAAFEAIRSLVTQVDTFSSPELVSGCMALVTLGCRNGFAVCGSVELVAWAADFWVRWLGSLSASAGEAELTAGGAVTAMHSLIFMEAGSKMGLGFDEFQAAILQGYGVMLVPCRALTGARALELINEFLDFNLLAHDDLTLACGCCQAAAAWIGYPLASVPAEADQTRLFNGSLALFRRVEPQPLSAEWWSSACEAINLTSLRLTCVWHAVSLAKILPSPRQSVWWAELLDRAIVMVKMNATAEMSGRDKMSFMCVEKALPVIELAAQDESQNAKLIELGVADALDYGMLNDFTFTGMSLAASSSGAAVALVGRNEGGKTLRREAVLAVLGKVSGYLNTGNISVLVQNAYLRSPATVVLSHFARIPIMAISDANKRHMLCFEPLVDMLLSALIIDDENSRKGQEGADALQEASAGVLHEMSLFVPGAAKIRAHPQAVPTLHKLCEVGTKLSQERAAAALFELEEDKRLRKEATDDGTGTGLVSQSTKRLSPPHVMVSYNWGHQDVILRVVASLQGRGYLVWVDTEQMKGATVDTMALAVEGSEVVLIGVSRAYKESSNCRMEAQYALQKKKALIPLMLVQGYEADGWLGLLLGSSMWYAFYGDTVSSESSFASRVDALVREIGGRGRADTEVVSVAEPEPEPESESVELAVAASELVDELRGLKLMALSKRALSAGVDGETVEDAMEADSPRSALIGLLVDVESRRGPADRVLSCLEAGGEACADTLHGVLDHAMEVIEALSTSSPRKARRSLRELLDRVEAAGDLMDDDWCDGASVCGREELDHLTGLLLAVSGLSTSCTASELSDGVNALLSCLDRCGSVVMQSVCSLRDFEDTTGGLDDGRVMRALDSLRGLSEDRLECLCADEVTAYELVMARLSVFETMSGSLEVLVSGCMAVFTLVCRNGAAMVKSPELGGSLYSAWARHIDAGTVASDVELRAGSAIAAMISLTVWECTTKTPSDSRVVETSFIAPLKEVYGTTKDIAAQRISDVIRDGAGMWNDQDLSISCGWGMCCGLLLYVNPEVAQAADEVGMFRSALTLLRRVVPTPLPVEWWLSTNDVVDMTSARMIGAFFVTNLSRYLPAATQSPWFQELLDHSIRLMKMNAAAGLTARDTIHVALVMAVNTMETAAKDESLHEKLIESGMMEALEYGILNDFSFGGISTAVYASGAAVSLVGRNEGGKMLCREAVYAVLDRLRLYMDPQDVRFNHPAKTVVSEFTRISTIAISDANKRHMLQFEPLIDLLLTYLVLDSNNRFTGQEGADTLQEASAGVIHELSLFGAGCAALRSHNEVLSTLHKLCEVGTKLSKERAAAALFELEDEKRASVASVSKASKGTGGGKSGGELPPPHVMVSYNWDHQGVILRVVASLQGRGYLVWVDTEQMKGATVDTMALAVEGSEVVLIGVSRAYKESSNCRMEAQYALQKKKALIPLMLVQGYEADGWLGLLLGSSMWYAFYGDTVSSESSFASRVDALVREIGGRGRADAVPAKQHKLLAGGGPLREELQTLRLSALKKRARAADVPEDDIEEAEDADDPKAAFIELVAAAEAAAVAPGGSDFDLHVRLRDELQALKMSQLKRHALAKGVNEHDLEEAEDADSPREAIIELVLQQE
jgi:hypothetical protein